MAKCLYLNYYCAIQSKMKKRSEATQTLRAGYGKADPQTNTHTNTQTGAITIHCAA